MGLGGGSRPLDFRPCVQGTLGSSCAGASWLGTVGEGITPEGPIGLADMTVISGLPLGLSLGDSSFLSPLLTTSSAASPRSTLGGGGGPGGRGFLREMGGVTPLDCVGRAGGGEVRTSAGAGLCGMNGAGLEGAALAGFTSIPSIWCEN